MAQTGWRGSALQPTPVITVDESGAYVAGGGGAGGATEAKQDDIIAALAAVTAHGTAGTPSADVLTVQGATAMTPLLVTPSGSDVTITFTPSCFAGALAIGDVAFATEAIANVVTANGGQFELASIQVSDISDLGAALDLYFFNANTSIGTEDAAPDIDDTEVLTTIIGPVRIQAADWVDLGANRVARLDNINAKAKAGAATTSIWVAGVTQTAATFAAGTLQFQFTFVRR